MRRDLVTAWLVGILLAGNPTSGQAFECPEHFKRAGAAINDAAVMLEANAAGLSAANLAAIEVHLRNARMSLVEAKFHHPQNENHHHTRSIVRADEAGGHAAAAIALYRKLSGS